MPRVWILVLRLIAIVAVLLEFCRDVAVFHQVDIHSFIDLLEEKS